MNVHHLQSHLEPFQVDTMVSRLDYSIVNVTEQSRWVFLHLSTSSGIVGIGEASQSGNDAAVLDSLRHLSQKITGRSIKEVRRRLAASLNDAGLLKAQDIITATALSAVDQALWDIEGKSLNRPVYELLGKAFAEPVPVYANINRSANVRTPLAMADTARRALDEGFRAIKCAPFDNVAGPPWDQAARLRIGAGIDRVAAIRSEIGSEVSLMVDCHRRFNESMAFSVGKLLEPFDLTWIEEPTVPYPDVTAFSRICARLEMPVAGGERLVGNSAYRDFITQSDAQIVMPDVKHCGGITSALQVAAEAADNEMWVSPHNPSGPVSTLATAHLAQVLPNFMSLEYPFGESTQREELTGGAEKLIDGYISPPESPGLGVEMTEVDIRPLASTEL